jgi:hypothetical protein
VRLSAVLTTAGLLGALLFAALIALWAVGTVGVAECAALAVYGLLRDDGRAAQPVAQAPWPPQQGRTLQEIWDRSRAS